MTSRLECGGSTPLLAGRHGGRSREPRLAEQSGTEVPHSIVGLSEGRA